MIEIIEVILGVSALVLLLVISLVFSNREYKLQKKKVESEIEEHKAVIDALMKRS